jgi:hypothetical protein
MANLRGDSRTVAMAELLPGAFVKSDLPRA